MSTILLIAILLFAAMCIITGAIIGAMIAYEYFKEHRWLRSYRSRRK